MAERYVVIMAGGRGERFWPESRQTRPKQLLPIVGDKPMLAQTVERLNSFVGPERVFVITHRDQRDAVLEACPELDPAKVIGEPTGRDTAAAVGLATVLVRRENPEATFAMLPADAVIHDRGGFQTVLESAFAAAEAANALVTIGIKPDLPATGFGYIKQGEAKGERAGRSVYAVERFVEKPDAETAKQYLASGDYYWNAGMFIWSVASISEALRELTPELWHTLREIEQRLGAGEALETVLDACYPRLEKISVDYAVIEKADRVEMVESAFDWDDVGAWPAIARHYPQDEQGNVVRGEAELMDARNAIVFSRDPNHLVALLGVDDLIVVRTEDATLVCHRDHAQKIKDLVKAVGAKDAWKSLT